MSARILPFRAVLPLVVVLSLPLSAPARAESDLLAERVQYPE